MSIILCCSYTTWMPFLKPRKTNKRIKGVALKFQVDNSMQDLHNDNMG